MSDKEAEKYKRKPILNIDERYIMVSACKYVSKVFINAPMPITLEFIQTNKIDIVIHADDISDSSRKYWYRIPIELNIYTELEYTKGVSTSEIIRRIHDYKIL